ncbi:MAG: ATP-dependent DNA helicase RecG [Pirellulaceae bacterium]|nr:ATP-dependent DNA helicase RecG [Pirellulaceae bacterium]
MGKRQEQAAKEAKPGKGIQTLLTEEEGVPRRLFPYLQKLGLRCVYDLLYYFPKRYEKPAPLTDWSDLEEGVPATVQGEITQTESKNMWYARRTLFSAVIENGEESIKAVWFNQPYRAKQLAQGMEVLLTGVPKKSGGLWEMVHPQPNKLDNGEGMPDLDSLIPVYSLTEGLKQYQLRQVIQTILKKYLSEMEDVLPSDFQKEHNLWSLEKSLPVMHKPKDSEALAKARERFVFQELLTLQLALAVRRFKQHGIAKAPIILSSEKIDNRIKKRLLFELTEEQEKVIEEILEDMGKKHPMNRLLQGDVGSGKTVVAAYVMLVAIAQGYQAVLMAPTEILARQHYETFQKILKNAKVQIDLLVGKQGVQERKNLLQDIVEGKSQIVIGTQALLQEKVAFEKLGLVVIDEQHKFGVQQRALLRESSGIFPHYLVMTATPIPRTVAMTAFGDLDISTITKLPPGRAKVHTYLFEEGQREAWWQSFRKGIEQGRQGYVIAPFVESEDFSEVDNVTEVYNRLKDGELLDLSVGILHGRMSTELKEKTMRQFAENEIDVLVATSVVEVGIDVPNATLMTIESGQRFGMAQLHQLRGRVSRGTTEGHVAIFAKPPNELAAARLAAVVDTNNGFELAEKDLQLRGPGDLFSTQQHGLPPLRIADLIRDEKIVLQARKVAQSLVEEGPIWKEEEYRPLRNAVLRRYGKVLDLGDVG